MKTFLATTAALALSASFALAQDVIRMGTEGAYPPYNFIDDNGDVAGFDIAVGNEVCARAELECEWVTNDWDSIINNLLSGNYDTIMAGMSITEERDQVIDFTQPYTQPDPSAYAAMSEDPDLTESVIAVQTGTLQAGHVAESGATPLEYATPDEALAAVRNGEADALFADKGFLESIVAEDSDLSFVGDDVLLGDGMGIGVRESDAELKEKLDEAIQSMKDDGTLNAMIEEWLPESASF